LDIKVLAVSRRVTEENSILIRWDIEVKALVWEVRRTGSRLRPGSCIVIRYSAHRYKKRGETGPGSFPVLVKGEGWSAALNLVSASNHRYSIPGGAPYNPFTPPAKKK